MAVKLTKQERRDIQNNQELMSQLVLADIIAVENSETGERQALWTRLVDDVIARGTPAKVVAISFSVDDESDIRDYQALVNCLKKSDSSP